MPKITFDLRIQLKIIQILLILCLLLFNSKSPITLWPNPTSNICNISLEALASRVGKKQSSLLKNNFLRKSSQEYMSVRSNIKFWLMYLFVSRPNFFILDEPTNHLDIETVEALGKALLKFNVSFYL